MRFFSRIGLVCLLAAVATGCGSSSSNKSNTGGSSGNAGAGGTSSGGTSASGGSSGNGATGGSGGSSGSSGSAGSAGASGSAGAGGSGGGTMITPGDPGAHDVLFTIDSSKDAHAISRYIYGTNQGDLTKEAKGLTLTRVGGNRLTAYNWETNASNAGSDYQYENDNYMSSSTVAGAPMKAAVQAASSAGASIIMTVPIAGWVSADENGPCPSNPTQAQIAQRFEPIEPAKGSAFQYPPDTSDGKVYADEFVHWLESQFPTAQTDPARRIFYMLDNEPDLWSSTHSEIHPAAVTYAELVQKSIAFATAIKAVAPSALIFGPVDYGWQGMVNLQNAPDANNRDWLEFYLDSMKAAEQTAGKRLLDVLDVHWYPEATGGGTRITDDGTGDAEVAARLQAPRSLWDPTYTETSWITEDSTNGPIELIPRLEQKIAQHYPGTKLSISEYNYGAGGDISGGVAEADALGVFGREGLFAASVWLLSQTNDYLFAGFAMYRNYDGQGATFGDTSIQAQNSDVANASVYASVNSSNKTDVIVVAINKATSAKVAGITLAHTSNLKAADVYTLTSASSQPEKAAGLTAVATNAFSYTMPAESVSTLVFHP
jgi:Glycoside hydrolase family 44